MPLVDHNLFTLPEHMSSPTNFLGSCYSNFSFVWNFCSSNLFFFWPLYCLSFDLRLMIFDLRLKIICYYNNCNLQRGRFKYTEHRKNEEYIRASYLLYFTNIKLLLYQKRQSLIITSQSCLLSAYSCFSGVRAARSLVFCVVLCRSLFVLVGFVLLDL